MKSIGVAALLSISDIQSYIEATPKDASLYEENNFDRRMEVIDFIGFQMMDQIEELLRKTDQPATLIALKSHAEQLKSELEDIDNRLFQQIQAAIRTGVYTGKAFKDLVAEYVDLTPGNCGRQEETGYDNLDIFINGLFSFQRLPEQTRDLEPEMVYYQKTPARIVFELVEKTPFSAADVFFDLGSGLGQVAILVNILAGITVKGVEFEPAFCDYARNCAAELNLTHVTFINVDARKADYSDGTIFFMFTPFRGEILHEVLEMLRAVSLLRKITIITYGPCTAQVAVQSWLLSTMPEGSDVYKYRVFSSRFP